MDFNNINNIKQLIVNNLPHQHIHQLEGLYISNNNEFTYYHMSDIKQNKKGGIKIKLNNKSINPDSIQFDLVIASIRLLYGNSSKCYYFEKGPKLKGNFFINKNKNKNKKKLKGGAGVTEILENDTLIMNRGMFIPHTASFIQDCDIDTVRNGLQFANMAWPRWTCPEERVIDLVSEEYVLETLDVFLSTTRFHNLNNFFQAILSYLPGYPYFSLERIIQEIDNTNPGIIAIFDATGPNDLIAFVTRNRPRLIAKVPNNLLDQIITWTGRLDVNTTLYRNGLFTETLKQEAIKEHMRDEDFVHNGIGIDFVTDDILPYFPNIPDFLKWQFVHSITHMFDKMHLIRNKLDLQNDLLRIFRICIPQNPTRSNYIARSCLFQIFESKSAHFLTTEHANPDRFIIPYRLNNNNLAFTNKWRQYGIHFWSQVFERYINTIEMRNYSAGEGGARLNQIINYLQMFRLDDSPEYGYAILGINAYQHPDQQWATDLFDTVIEQIQNEPEMDFQDWFIASLKNENLPATGNTRSVS